MSRAMSKQLKYQRQHKAQGLCIYCKQPAYLKKNGSLAVFCWDHAIRKRELQRKRCGFKRRNTGASSYIKASAA